MRDSIPRPPNHQTESARADLAELRDPLLLRLLPGHVRRAEGQAHRLPTRLQVLLHEPRVVSGLGGKMATFSEICMILMRYFMSV